MPKLYESFGLIILFYSNEHEPIHVHGKYQGRENKAEIIFENGKFKQIESLTLKVNFHWTPRVKRNLRELSSITEKIL